LVPCNGKRYIAFVFGDVIAILIPGSNVARIVRLPNRLYPLGRDLRTSINIAHLIPDNH
jgi:hypothetical protein